MKPFLYILILGLFCTEMFNQFYIYSLLRKLFPRVYSGTEKLRHSKKIGWLKSNVAQLEPEDRQQAQKVLFHHKLSIYLIVALFIVFYGGLILGVNK